MLFFTLILGFVSSLRADERIRIVAANLTSGNGQDYDPGHGTRILQGLQPDIVLVQEFNYLSNTSADFRAWVDTTFGPTFSYMREPGGDQIPNGIVSRYPILASGEWNDANVSNRDFAWARIDIPGDRDLWVISVHFLTTSSANRNAEASQVLNYIAAQGVPSSDYVVLGGDFNTDSRNEACINTLSSYFVTSGPFPVDQAGNGNTNAGRNKPYDWVLADTDLHALKTPVVLGTNSFANGLLFDSRVYTPLPSPVLAGDSGATNMQHMAVVRDFLIPSSSGPAVPAIFSAATASGVVDQTFSYQIAATSTPTAFGASGLPAGLSVNTTSGLISGTPTSAGSATITLSATNATGTGTATLALTVNAAGGGGGSYVVNFEDGTKTAYASADVTLNGLSWNMTEVLIGDSASDIKNGAKSARLRGYATSVMTMLADRAGGIGTISFQYGPYGTDAQVEWIVEYSANAGSSWTEAGRFTAGAGVATFSATVQQAAAGRMRIRTAATGATNRRVNVDDITITTASAATPTLTTSGTLAAVDTTYGTASPTPTRFTVAGTDLTAGILVTPPAGFEVSQTAGGASGYAATQTVGAAGAVTATTVYLRLAANTAAGNHVGVVTCSSPGASSVTVPVAPSTVGPRSLVITAQDRTKAFGTVFSAGTSAFTSSGLVSGQTIGAVVLTTVGGTATYDAAGAYAIFPSNASGGTFAASNYAISYVQGTLTVTAPSFADWADGLADPTASGDSDGDGVANLLEYYQGLDPETADAVALQIQFAGTELFFDYRRNKAVAGVTGVVEWTTDLAGGAAWSEEGVNDEPLEDFDLYETRRATVPMDAGETKKFLRLRVSLP